MERGDTLSHEYTCPAKPSGLSGASRLGEPVVPLILAELEREISVSWITVLAAITGENPLPSELAGRVDAMTQAWLDWGRQQGYAV